MNCLQRLKQWLLKPYEGAAQNAQKEIDYLVHCAEKGIAPYKPRIKL